MIRVLALGPGPISVVIDAADLDDAIAMVDRNAQDWIDGHANALDVPLGSPESAVDEALEREGWSLNWIAAPAPLGWFLHERSRFDDE